MRFRMKSIIDTKVNACNTYLKSGKANGSECPKSDHFINSTNELYVIISFLYTSFLFHGFSTNTLILCCVV